ncbi:Hypothetical protein A7982_04073 [Minicystis rosea]|nr:Hypothetical protein A7982_04073 [Minicystis rosea]
MDDSDDDGIAGEDPFIKRFRRGSSHGPCLIARGARATRLLA